MRIAVLSFDDPWRGDHGGTLRTRAFVDGFAALGHEVICVYAGADASEVRNDGPVTRVSVRGRPAGERGAGVGRLGRLKRTYLPLPTIRGGRIRELAEALAENGPYELIVIQQLRGLPYVSDAQCAFWLDQTDMWSRFLESEIGPRRGLKRASARLQQRHFRRLERIHSRRAAHVTAAGAADAREMASLGRRPVEWLPTSVRGFSEPIVRADGGVPTAGLIANFGYWPNRDAFDLLVTEWLGPLREAGWNVLVAGLGASDLPAVEGIRNIGAVDSVPDFYEQVDVCLSPIRLGGGVKVKVLEALAAGRPVFATSESCDGFPPHSVPGVVIVDATVPRFLAPADIASSAELVSPETARLFMPEGFGETLARVLAE